MAAAVLATLVGLMWWKGEPFVDRALVSRLPERFAGLQPVVDRLMARRPEDRYADAGEVVADLDRLKGAVD